METDNASEVDETDKSNPHVSGIEFGDKSAKIKVCFSDIDQSEDYVSDLNAEVDLDESVEVSVSDEGINMDNNHSTVEGQESTDVDPDMEEKCYTETPELNENTKEEKDAINEENKRNNCECKIDDSEVEDTVHDRLTDNPEESEQLSSDIHDTEMGNNLNGNESGRDGSENMNAETCSDEKNIHQIPQNDSSETQKIEENTDAMDFSICENVSAISDSKEGDNVSESGRGESGTDVDKIEILDIKPDEHCNENEEEKDKDTNQQAQEESSETKDIIDDTKVGFEKDIEILKEQKTEIEVNNTELSKENENSGSIESVTLNRNNLENVENDPDSLDKEGIKQFLKAVIDDLQGIVIETEECDTVVKEINAKNEDNEVDNNIIEIKVENSTTPESDDECIAVNETEVKLENLELIIDNNDSDDTELINDVKECELLIEERSDETVQCDTSFEVETKDVMETKDTEEADGDSTKDNSNSTVEQIKDEEPVLELGGDTTNQTGDLSSDENANKKDCTKFDDETSSSQLLVEPELVLCEGMDYESISTTTEGASSVKPEETTGKMLSEEKELQDFKSALKVSQQLLQDERSKHNREVMSLKLQLCRSQMQLKCQRSRSEKQMTDIMAQLVVLESRLRQEQKNLKKELRNKNQTIVSQKQEITKLKDQNEQLLNAIKEIYAKGGMNGYMRENRRKNGSNSDVDNGGKSGKEKKGNNSSKLGSVKDKLLSKNRSSLELHSFNLEKYRLQDDRLCSSQEDLRKITDGRRRSIPNGDSSLNGDEGFDMTPRDRPHSDSTEYKNSRKQTKYSQNFFSEMGSPQYEINKSISESSHLSENSNSSSGVYSLSDHDLSTAHDDSMTNGNQSNDYNYDDDDDRIFSFSSTHINTVIDEEDVMGPISHSGPVMSMGSMPMLANLSDEQSFRSGKNRPHSLSSVDLASIQLQAENLSSPGGKHPRSPLASEMGTPPSSPSYLQNKNEMTPFQTFKTMFRRKGSSKNKGHKKRSVSLSQTTNMEYSEALKKHFQKYDMQ